MKLPQAFSLLRNTIVLVISLQTNIHAMSASGETKSPETRGTPWAPPAGATMGDSKRAAADAPAAPDTHDEVRSLDDAVAALVVDDKLVTIQAKDGSVEFSLTLLERYSQVVKTMIEYDPKASDQEHAQALSEILKSSPMATLQALKTVLESLDKDKKKFVPREQHITNMISVLDKIYLQVQEKTSNPDIIIDIYHLVSNLNIKKLMVPCVRWFTENRVGFRAMDESKFPKNYRRFSNEDWLLSGAGPLPGGINLRVLLEHDYLSDLDFSDMNDIASKSRGHYEEAMILISKLPMHNLEQVRIIIEPIDRSPLKDAVLEEVINNNCTDPYFDFLFWDGQLSPAGTRIRKDALLEEFIANNYTNPDFDFLFWYKRLTVGRNDEKPALSVRSRVIEAMQARAHKFVGDAKVPDRTEIITKFVQLPEGYFKMLVRQQFQALYDENIQESHDGTIPPMDINEIIACINSADGKVRLVHKKLTTIAGIDALLVIRNEIQPIIRLWLCHNKLATITIPTELTALQELGLSYNELPTITIPTELTALQELTFSYNKLPTITIPALPALKIVSVAANKLTAITIDERLTTFEYFDLSYNLLGKDAKKILHKRFGACVRL